MLISKAPVAMRTGTRQRGYACTDSRKDPGKSKPLGLLFGGTNEHNNVSPADFKGERHGNRRHNIHRCRHQRLPSVRLLRQVNLTRAVMVRNECGEKFNVGCICASKLMRQVYQGKRHKLSPAAVLSIGRGAGASDAWKKRNAWRPSRLVAA